MAPKEIGSCTGYLELMPHKTITLLDLVRILFSSNNSLANQEFIDVSESHHLQGLEIRWIIFLSLFTQKILLYLKKPMVWTRDAIEMWLNLLSSNGGLVKLFLSILTGLVQACMLLLNHFLSPYVLSLIVVRLYSNLLSISCIYVIKFYQEIMDMILI